MYNLLKYNFKNKQIAYGVSILAIFVYGFSAFVLSGINAAMAITLSTFAFLGASIMTVIYFFGVLDEDFTFPEGALVFLAPVSMEKFLLSRIISTVFDVAFWFVVVLVPFITLGVGTDITGITVNDVAIFGIGIVDGHLAGLGLLGGLRFIFLVYFSIIVCCSFGLRGFMQYVVAFGTIALSFWALNWITAGFLILFGASSSIITFNFGGDVGGALHTLNIFHVNVVVGGDEIFLLGVYAAVLIAQMVGMFYAGVYLLKNRVEI